MKPSEPTMIAIKMDATTPVAVVTPTPKARRATVAMTHAKSPNTKYSNSGQSGLERIDAIRRCAPFRIKPRPTIIRASGNLFPIKVLVHSGADANSSPKSIQEAALRRRMVDNGFILV